MEMRVLAVVGVVVLGVGCASYAAKTVPINQPQAYPHKQTVENVTIVADVYTTEAKYKSVFDTIPSFERGYLPINVIIYNDSPDTLQVTVGGMSVTTRSGVILQPISAEQVAEQVLRSTTGRYFAGGVLAAGSSKGANDRIRADFAAKGLKDHAIPPGGRSQGFLFFANTEQFQVLTVRGLLGQQAIEIAMPDIPLFGGQEAQR